MYNLIHKSDDIVLLDHSHANTDFLSPLLKKRKTKKICVNVISGSNYTVIYVHTL